MAALTRSVRGIGAVLSMALVVAALGIGCAGASAAWTVPTLTLPPHTAESTLNSVSCTGEICWAVGDYRNTSGVLAPLAYQPFSNMYALPPSPGNSPELNSISCTSSTFCMAVGRFKNSSGNFEVFGEKFNGVSWELQTLPTPAGNFSSELGTVSCSSSNECVAVGDYHKLPPGIQYLGERWTSAGGGTWTAEEPTQPSGLGYQFLSALSCPATGECVGIGDYRVSPWGTANEKVETETYSSSRPSPTWRYKGYSTAGIPFGPTTGSLSTMAGDWCISTTECISVGFYTNTSSKFEMLVYKGISGTADWVRQTALPAVPEESDLHGIYCPSAVSSCYAVGRQTPTAGGVGKPLALQSSGGVWTQIALPTVPEGILDSVSCIAEALWCVTVGQSGTSALVERNP